ncbi:hypothetical protein BV22DRAFT_1049927 [Leucogyrophana mollusca]|uniref:Uncharacterized protein n=1 Tax=Leucogyrophana mollusca TaxID=85980 RepID=A0ACB8B730_9AGAM|nr:hypothetical protein BV22DRAFT_1049927 [Leucogyrophana mollusca]
MSTPIIVDDTSMSIVYTGFWLIAGTYPEYVNTTHGAMTAGSSLQARFWFNGTHVAVYGTVPAAEGLNLIPPESMYNVDQLPTSTYMAPSSPTVLYSQVFYDSGVLEDGPHELVITPAVNQTSTVWLDYLEYVPSGPSMSVLQRRS